MYCKYDEFNDTNVLQMDGFGNKGKVINSC